MFPGAHCPLMGAAMAVRGIRDSLIIIIGTDECAYYTKHMTLHSDDFGGLGGRCVSVVLDGHDVTFGCLKKVEAAFGEVMAEYRPQAVFLVTTCVVEIIGDDMDAAAFREWARLMHRRSDTLYEDAMIAATARVHGLTVVSRNVADFKALGMEAIDPFTAR